MEDQPTLALPARAPDMDVDRNLPLRSALSSLTGMYVMAVTGLVLMLFVLVHMAGNLLIFSSRGSLNAYASGLEEHSALLWAARAVLLLVFVIHIVTGVLLTLQSRAARPIRYVCWKPLQSSWAARHMLLTGVLVLAFVVYHLLHFTFGVTDPEHFKDAIPRDPRGRHDVAGMVVGGFSQTPVAVGYIAAQILLGLHLAHGAWSWFQHLGWNRENHLKPWSWFPPLGPGRRGYARLVHGFGFVVAVSVVLGNCSIPLAIQLGWRPNGLEAADRAPSSRKGRPQAMSRHTFLLEPVPPFRLDLTVWTLRRRPDNVVDRWDGTTYRRVLPLPAGPVEVAVTQVTPPETPQLKVAVADQPIRAAVRAAVTSALVRLLGLRIDLTEFYQFAAHHRRLGQLAQRFRGGKPPRFATVFEGVINAIACQQVTLTLGICLLNRLAVAAGPAFGEGNEAVHAFPRPDDLAPLSPEALRQFGFSRQKGRAMIELAQSVAEGRLDLEGLAALSDDEVIDHLCELRGVGRWTAEYTLLRGLGRVHVFPGDDVGARNNLRRWLRLRKTLDYEGVRRVLAGWGGYAGLVYFHLLLDRLEEMRQRQDHSGKSG